MRTLNNKKGDETISGHNIAHYNIWDPVRNRTCPVFTRKTINRFVLKIPQFLFKIYSFLSIPAQTAKNLFCYFGLTFIDFGSLGYEDTKNPIIEQRFAEFHRESHLDCNDFCRLQE